MYSFDLCVLLFGVCFNLAGLPYSAGFLGKEFLLFQVLRDDFISFVVRGCWLVSFFFTPIYMFILNFIVMFGTKKGSISVYKTAWSSLLLYQVFLVFYDFKQVSLPNLSKMYSYRYHHTIITSRTTSYFLLLLHNQ